MSRRHVARKTLCTTPGCGQPTTKQHFVCRSCIEALSKDLAAVPALLDELATTMARLDRMVPSGRLGDSSPLLHRPVASEVRWVLINTTTTWVRLVLEHRGLPMPELLARGAEGVTTPDHAVQGAARWMLRHVHALAMTDSAGQAVDEFAEVVRLAYRTIDRPPELLPAGQCGHEDCEAFLYATADAATITCRGCGSDHDAAERREWMAQGASEQWLTATQALGWVRLLLGKQVPSGTWRSWLSRGQITHVDADHVGRKLFRFGDVLDLAREWEARPRRTSKRPAA